MFLRIIPNSSLNYNPKASVFDELGPFFKSKINQTHASKFDCFQCKTFVIVKDQCIAKNKLRCSVAEIVLDSAL